MSGLGFEWKTNVKICITQKIYLLNSKVRYISKHIKAYPISSIHTDTHMKGNWHFLLEYLRISISILFLFLTSHPSPYMPHGVLYSLVFTARKWELKPRLNTLQLDLTVLQVTGRLGSLVYMFISCVKTLLQNH